MRRTIERIGLLALNLFFMAICFAILVPILYAFSISLNAQNSILGSNFSFIPQAFTLANYQAVLFEQPVLLWLGNTAILAVSSVVISLTPGG